MRRTRHKGQCGHQTHCFQHTFHFLSIRGDRPLCRRSLPIRCKESANSYLPFLKVHLSSFPLQRYNNFPTKQISNGKYMQNKRYSSPHRYNAAIFRTRCNREIEPDRTGCGRIFSLRRIIYFYPKYPLIYFNGRSEDDSVHRRRNSTNFGERHSAAEWGLPAGIAQRIEPPPRNIVGIGMQRSIRTRCLAAQPPSGLRRFGKTKPRTRNRNPGPPSPPRRGGGSTYPRNTARTKRLLPNEKSQSPRTTGRGCPTICRQPLRYGFPAATSPKSGVNGCGTSPHSIFRTRRR